MKLARRALPFLLITFLALPWAAAQVPQFSPFTADMEMKSTNPNAPQDAKGKVFVGSGHMRMNISAQGHETAMITDFATRTVSVLLVEPKMYMQHQAGAMSRRGIGGGPADEMKPFDPANPCANQPDITCKKIGVETLSDRTCDHWEITDKNGKVTNVWVDEKLHFPIKMASTDSTILLTNIKEGEPDAALFQIPSDFKKMDMSGMMAPGMARPPQN